MDIGTIIAGSVGIVTTLCSSWVSWFFTKERYKGEVDSIEIQNFKDSLDFYEKIVKDNNANLQRYIEITKENRIEVYRLKGIIHRLLNNSCLDKTCTKRVFYTDSQIRKIIKGTNNKQSKDDTKIKEDTF